MSWTACSGAAGLLGCAALQPHPARAPTRSCYIAARNWLGASAELPVPFTTWP